MIAVVAAALIAAASPVVDRTFVCGMTGEGYPDPVRYLDVHASSRQGKSSASGGVHNVPRADDGVSVSFRTGTDFFGRGTGSVAIRGCTTTGLRAELSTRGLRGGRVVFSEQHKCEVPAKVLIRIRAVFKRPVTLRRERGALVARGSISTAQIAVSTHQGRRPIAYVSADDATGKARIFTSSSRCFPD